MVEDRQNRILSEARRRLIRASDLASLGVARTYLRDLVRDERLLKVGRGRYLAADADITEHLSLAEVASRYPKAVIDLLTALRFHDLTQENPSSVHVKLPRGARRPRLNQPALEVNWEDPGAYLEGTEVHHIAGVDVRITTPARTVADCFKYRSRIGESVAVEALFDAWRKKKASADDLWAAAKATRMLKVMQPYFEAMTK